MDYGDPVDSDLEEQLAKETIEQTVDVVNVTITRDPLSLQVVQSDAPKIDDSSWIFKCV